jgi:hypothetical protein
VGFTVIGSRTVLGRIDAGKIGRLWQHAGWQVEGKYMISTGDSFLTAPFPTGSTAMTLGLQNFRAKALRVVIRDSERVIVERNLMPGRSDIEIGVKQVNAGLTVTTETWVPDEELANGDCRRIGIHLEEVVFT